ncbi:MAG: iron ABC transporter permease [Bacteroides sp.]|nr:iron ABC transporter permease [Bacteroides sp.]MCM1413217.1 iron ABC transporter permease [Bacteroides sp.]MCM1471473.1 iron ABC transporter permease [Bacteroides sp.]
MALTALLSLVGCLLSGSVDIPPSQVWHALTGGSTDKEAWRIIVVETRIPMVLTATLAGAALAVAGLLLQTCFNNPLAGPSILGISSGASLGVAVVVMTLGGALSSAIGQYLSMMAAAAIGAMAVILLLLLMSRLVRSTALLLIAGILISYFSSSVISLLNFFATHDSVYSFTVWGLGSFGGGSLSRSLIFATIGALLVAASMLFIKPLNAMLLGPRYAESMGINVRRTRHMLLLVTGLLTAAVTAFCGPIGFLGLIVPHIARMALRTSNHAVLLPATALCGAATALLCAWLSVGLGGNGVIPINAITPVIGVPIVIYVMLNRKRLLYFD